ncbi:hypothetical protein [Heyndrickxia acidicola]|uniref:Uncharacterized protein n=1 Tax=Heyndrickxia acidicola TaxID=209389 RepID=A0ABU6MFU3_9BACI|nr:hypothetical protein [Heyndrickxia acidicola]MED1203144.1 hypothetical protein [Heyndrickxia acidicola]
MHYRQVIQNGMHTPHSPYPQTAPQTASVQKQEDPEYARLKEEIRRMEKDMDRMNRRILLIELQLNNLTPAGLAPPIMELPPMAKMDAMEKQGYANYKNLMSGMNPFGINSKQSFDC